MATVVTYTGFLSTVHMCAGGLGSLLLAVMAAHLPAILHFTVEQLFRGSNVSDPLPVKTFLNPYIS